jgi:hypothetical protein
MNYVWQIPLIFLAGILGYICAELCKEGEMDYVWQIPLIFLAGILGYICAELFLNFCIWLFLFIFDKLV